MSGVFPTTPRASLIFRPAFSMSPLGLVSAPLSLLRHALLPFLLAEQKLLAFFSTKHTVGLLPFRKFGRDEFRAGEDGLSRLRHRRRSRQEGCKGGGGKDQNMIPPPARWHRGDEV